MALEEKMGLKRLNFDPNDKRLEHYYTMNMEYRGEGVGLYLAHEYRVSLPQSAELGKGDELPILLVPNRQQWARKGPGTCKTRIIVQGRIPKAPMSSES